jgi:hypothetical protein
MFHRLFVGRHIQEYQPPGNQRMSDRRVLALFWKVRSKGLFPLEVPNPSSLSASRVDSKTLSIFPDNTIDSLLNQYRDCHSIMLQQ